MAVLRYLTLLVAVVSVLVWLKLNQTPAVPRLDSTWWVTRRPEKADGSIRPFTINISDSVIRDLHERLKSTPKLTPPLEGIGFEYGFNSKYLEEVLEFWRTKYDWREREKFLNKFPQYKTTVDGLVLHFLRVKPANVPKGVDIVPLLLLHGWPGSVREFYSVIPLLTTPREGQDFVFEVVAPSLPGYGFSQGAQKPGLGAAQVAVVMKDLMERLGFTKFYVQGGDWGSVIGTHMATLYPERVLGYHSNMCFSQTATSTLKRIFGSFWPTLIVEEQYVDKVYPLSEKMFAHLLEETGYMHIQSSKPDTIGIALQTSPAALAAYILEKFSTWTNPSWKSLPDGGLTRKYTLTDLLDNIMIYWVTGSITTSVRLYSESFNKAQYALNLESIPNVTPTACAQFVNEIIFTPESLVRDKHVNLVRYTVLPRGGHFAAFEEPQLLADDVWESIRAIRQRSSSGSGSGSG
ncbi:juvenile hormone epoxide hydrolase 1-like [Schistocerca piceifrons]|uniref:juvenile hormone epoxide hydrolase 1-like n=1 Tax=Schistocerca piceifrons TaxID=274613 RepID=UPI001F5E5F78|nr:juvenile hormone epoxide hydrolase 1-like [Schistocerca piceifrons]